mmetsp:Transcript_45397/g.98806  ORF Transcript_45397/g.98806 Transcript_45397/m.98806 type:complete len:105 (-) Transcript_45397:271-585(-)
MYFLGSYAPAIVTCCITSMRPLSCAESAFSCRSPDRTPYRHESQEVYLEHLQAVAELLIRWGRVASVKRQIQETDKSPRRGTIPIKTVPLRLDLPNELVRSFRK